MPPTALDDDLKSQYADSHAFRGTRVACHSCESDRVSVGNVMQGTFMLEHF